MLTDEGFTWDISIRKRLDMGSIVALILTNDEGGWIHSRMGALNGTTTCRNKNFQALFYNVEAIYNLRDLGSCLKGGPTWNLRRISRNDLYFYTTIIAFVSFQLN